MVATNFYGYVERNNFPLTMLLVRSYDQVHTVQMTLKTQNWKTCISVWYSSKGTNVCF
jgi:hypothetical protein